MKGDFSVLNFDPLEHARGVATPADGILRNLGAVLHQQGRVMSDADLTEGELLGLGWQGQAARDIIGAGVCAVPAEAPDGFRVVAARVAAGEVQVALHPGRAWADGILTRLAGDLPDADAPVVRRAAYFGPPIADPAPTAATVGDDIRDAVILEVSQDALHALQYPERLIEPALGGPDTAERAFVNTRIRLLRLAEGEDCTTISGRLRDDPALKGRLTVLLAPVVALVGDCPVVGGGGYTGFEHALYRIEIADGRPGDPARFKWSMWNGSLAGRGRFDATVNPNRVYVEAGRTPIVTSGVTDFYLEALQYDALDGTWNTVFATPATLNTDHDLELTAPPTFGAMPATTEPVFFRLWNGIGEITAFTNAVNPVELRDGIRLAFDAPGAGNYRPGDYWTFKVRAGEIANPQVLVDDAPPAGILMHRVPLAEINWTARRDTTISGSIEDCRHRFRPLTNQKICCTFLIGNGISSFGDFNSLEEAAMHLPAAGGELCLLPGLHRANLRLEGRRNVKIHGCTWRSIVLPREGTQARPILHFVDCTGIEVCDLDLVTYDGIAVMVEGSTEDACSDVRIHDNRMVARINAIRAENAQELVIAGNRLHLLDTTDGRATISIAADEVLVERNTLVLLPFVDETPGEDTPDDDPTRDPADPCARPLVLYRFPALVLLYIRRVFDFAIAQIVPVQPYLALGGIHVRPGSERVRLLENRIVGGAGNGIVLGGDIDPAPPPPDTETTPPVTVNVTANGRFTSLVQDEDGRALPDVDVYLDADAITSDRSDTRGMASLKAAPGAYRLSVAAQHRIVRVAEARDQGTLVNIITVATDSRRAALRGFLHEIAIEGNDVSMMGLSGIGFAVRQGAVVTGRQVAIPDNDPRGALLAYVDRLLATMALTPILRATDPVRGLLIRGNRLHHNLRNPFTQAMLDDAQFIGRGGISLGMVEALVLADNAIQDNGPSATDPACGIFIGYGDDLEISGNALAGNGAITGDFEANRRAGIRGGIYIRFAGALTTHLSQSSGRKPALRVIDNRVDQPAGRALTAFGLGPMTVASNHLSSERTGLHGFVDTAVGGVLLLNLGGIHRLLARLFGNYLGRNDRYRRVADTALPGGETLFNDNYVRLDQANRSITAQLLASLDDLGFAANTSSVYRTDPFFANSIIVGDSLRATSSRLREDANRTVSLLTLALRANVTALNQGDHCILVRPRLGPDPLPTVAQGNQVINSQGCSFFDDNGLLPFLIDVLQANSDQLGGILPDDSFTPNQLAGVAQQAAGTALGTVQTTQTAVVQQYQAEAVRLTAKRGATHPTTVLMQARADAGTRSLRVLAESAEAATVQPPNATGKRGSLSGRATNDRGQGLDGLTVELVRANAQAVETVGRTDANGYFTAVFDEARTDALAREQDLFVRLLDEAGKELVLDKTPVWIAAGTDAQVTVTIPLNVIPRSVIRTATVIYGSAPPNDQPPNDTQPGTPPDPEPPPEPQPEPESRTPLEGLKLDDKTLKQLDDAGIVDVEGIVETGMRKLAALLGGSEPANRLFRAATAFLETKPPRTPRRGRKGS